MFRLSHCNAFPISCYIWARSNGTRLYQLWVWIKYLHHKVVNSLRPRQNIHHFPDDIFKRIVLNEYVWILIKISLKFISKGLINNNPALVQIMAWRRPGDKSLSEPMVVSLLTHICVTRPQWVKQGNQIKIDALRPQTMHAVCASQRLAVV